MRRRHVLQVLPLAIAGLHLGPVRGQAPGVFPDPSRPIRLVVPFPAGGTSDIRARQVAEHLRQDVGWTVVVVEAGARSGSLHTARFANEAERDVWIVYPWER